MKKITSIGDLHSRAIKDPKYSTLAIMAARNLGGPASSLDEAINILTLNAMKTSEAGVVGDINFCIPLM